MNKFRFILAYIVLFIGVFLITSAGSYMYCYIHSTNETEESFDEVRDLVQEIEIPKDEMNDYEGNKLELKPHNDYSELYEQNNDFIGWLKIDGTSIDYPVMLTPDNEEYYLHRNFQKQYDYNGTPFCEAEVDIVRPSNNITIYGHHIKGGIMFHSLDNYKKEEFYQEHKLITFDTIYRWSTYEVVAVYLTDVNPGSFEYWNVKDCTEEEFYEYVDFFSRKALYKTDLIDSVEYGDKLISLSTCAYHTTNGRLVVVAKMIESEETELYKSLDLENGGLEDSENETNE
ncbi:MAG: class B sortase [Bacilli bacterium]|nr:class B sortase [Bacilli bacterium]MBQ8218693.1 class B sortase [Bacilli bacterium]